MRTHDSMGSSLPREPLADAAKNVVGSTERGGHVTPACLRATHRKSRTVSVRTHERSKFLDLVLSCPVEFVVITIEANAYRQIEVQRVKLKHAAHAWRQRTGLHLNEPPLCIREVVRPCSRRR